MPTAVERFCAAAADLGVDVEARHFPDGTRTATDAARAVGCDVSQIVKSLVFVAIGPDGEEPVLALVSGANRVDEGRLAEAAGASEIRRATAQEARDATGFAIGGTPPFAHPRPLRTFLDPDLLDHDVVWAAAGTADTCFPVAPARLAEVAGATPVALAAP